MSERLVIGLIVGWWLLCKWVGIGVLVGWVDESLGWEGVVGRWQGWWVDVHV